MARCAWICAEDSQGACERDRFSGVRKMCMLTLEMQRDISSRESKQRALLTSIRLLEAQVKPRIVDVLVLVLALVFELCLVVIGMLHQCC